MPFEIASGADIDAVEARARSVNGSATAEVRSMDDLLASNAKLSSAPRSARADTDGPSVFQNLSPYPASLSSEAYYGLAGKFVRLVAPHTEADENFLLISFLIHAGNVFGRHAWVWAGGDKHF